MAADYVVLARELDSLALLGEIPRYTGLTWSRRAIEAGAFQLVAQQAQLDAAVRAALVSGELVIEIRRDGAPEFAGICQQPRYDVITQTWQLNGPCLKGWLADRVIVPPAGHETDSVSDVVAETAMKGYVDRHLVTPTDPLRAVANDLDDIALTIAPDNGRGGLVSAEKRFTPLLETLNELAVGGDLWHDVAILTDGEGTSILGYRYDVHAWRDATWGSGAVPVVFNAESTGQLVYERDLARPTTVYVLGDGDGASRTIEVVSVTGRRVETVLDASSASAAESLTQQGTTHLTEQQAAAERIDAQPLTVGPQLYRDAWDLGDVVTISVPDLGVQLDRQLVEVSVTLDAQQGETITVALGSLTPTFERRLASALKRLQPAGLQ